MKVVVPSGWSNTSGYGYNKGDVQLTGVTADDDNSDDFASSGSTLYFDRSLDGTGSIFLQGTGNPSTSLDSTYYALVNLQGEAVGSGVLGALGVHVAIPAGDDALRLIVGISIEDNNLDPREATHVINLMQAGRVPVELEVTNAAQAFNNGNRIITVDNGGAVNFDVIVRATNHTTGVPYNGMGARTIGISRVVNRATNAVVANPFAAVGPPVLLAGGNYEINLTSPAAATFSYGVTFDIVPNKLAGEIVFTAFVIIRR